MLERTADRLGHFVLLQSQRLLQRHGDRCARVNVEVMRPEQEPEGGSHSNGAAYASANDCVSALGAEDGSGRRCAERRSSGTTWREGVGYAGLRTAHRVSDQCPESGAAGRQKECFGHPLLPGIFDRIAFIAL